MGNFDAEIAGLARDVQALLPGVQSGDEESAEAAESSDVHIVVPTIAAIRSKLSRFLRHKGMGEGDRSDVQVLRTVLSHIANHRNVSAKLVEGVCRIVEKAGASLPVREFGGAQEQSFLRSVREHPDDLAHPSAYADWLMDHGRQEEGEVIKIILELRCEFHPARRRELRVRAVLLQDIVQKLWRRRFSDANLPVFHPVLRRGLLHEVQMGANGFRNHAEELFSMAPSIQSLKLNSLGIRDLAGVGDTPELVNIHELSLNGASMGGARETQLNEGQILALLRSPHLTGLQELSMARRAAVPARLSTAL